MVIEATLAHRHRFPQQLSQCRQITPGIKARCVMWMDPGGGENVAGILGGDFAGSLRRRQRFANADNGSGARIAGAPDYVVAVAAERRVREVGVAVDEDGRTPPV